MIFTYHIRKEKEIQRAVCNAMKHGLAKHGDELLELQLFDGVPPDVDGTIITGIGHSNDPRKDARNVFDSYLKAGKHVIFLDKGYTREDVLRVSVNSFQPLKYLNKVKRPLDRILRTGIRPEPYHDGGEYILFDGASKKYCQWCGLGSQLEWGQAIVDKIRANSKLPVRYRPRPGHSQPEGSIKGAELSQRPLREDLAHAALVVSHGGNIGFDTVVAGRPHFAIDVSIARPVSETDWANLGRPFVPTRPERWQWLANVAYCQWSLAELTNGTAWYVIRQQLALAA